MTHKRRSPEQAQLRRGFWCSLNVEAVNDAYISKR